MNIKEWNKNNGFKLIHIDILKVIMHRNKSLKTPDFKTSMINYGFSNELMNFIFKYQNPKEKSSWFDHQIRNTRNSLEKRGLLLHKDNTFYATEKLLNISMDDIEKRIQKYMKELTIHIRNNFKRQQEKQRENMNSSRAFGVMDAARAKKIGQKGEKIFFDHLTNKIHSYNDVANLLGDLMVEDFLWENETFEKCKPYDFIVGGQKFDVKTTISKESRFFLSRGEFELIQKQQLHIVQIWIGDSFEYLRHKVISSKEVIDLFYVEPVNFLVKPKK